MSRKNNFFRVQASCDADALAFLAATGITDVTISDAICTLYSELKAAGIYTKLTAFYPMVGGTAFTHKFNGKNPLDTNAAFRLVFNGGWTHSANGAQPNGINGYADTFVAGNVIAQNSGHLSYYSRSNTAGGSGVYKVEMGYLKLTPVITNVIIVKRDTISVGSISAGTTTTTSSITNTTGFYLANRVSAASDSFWKNGAIIISGANVSVAPSTINNWIGARNSADNPGANNYTDRQCAFASIGSGFTNAEILDYYTIIQTFQTALGRNV